MKKLDAKQVYIVRNPDNQNKPLFVLYGRNIDDCKKEVQSFLNSQKFDTFNYIFKAEIVPVNRDPFGGDSLTVYADSKHVLQIEGERIELTYSEAVAYQKATRSAAQYIKNNADYGCLKIDYKLPEVVENVIRKYLDIAPNVPISVSFTPENKQLVIGGASTPFDFGRYFPAVDIIKDI